ncbi:MAG: hypothetical protein HDT21_06935 [Ruminococcus sp.]|nr:hypothetical protein [Ruminococcus sp.]
METLNKQIIGENIPIFIRESLDDTGDHRCINHSPDIIVQKIKLSDPIKYLVNTYSSDISQDGDGSGKMYIYVRFKNTSKYSVENFYIHLYRNHLGLYNAPSDWKNYELRTEDGTPAKISSVAPGEIGVSPAFVYENLNVGIHPNCFVAVATKEKNPDFSSINNNNKYKEWIDQKNVAARNVSVRQFPKGRSEQFIKISNIEDNDVSVGLYVLVQGKTPSGTKYGIQNDELGIKDEYIFIKEDNKSSYIFLTAILPAKYSGELLVWSEVPESGTADILVTFWKMENAINGKLEQCAVYINNMLTDGDKKEYFFKDELHLLGGCNVINIVE